MPVSDELARIGRAAFEDRYPDADWEQAGVLVRAFWEGHAIAALEAAHKVEGEGLRPTGECKVAMSGPTCMNPKCPPCQTPELEGEGALRELLSAIEKHREGEFFFCNKCGFMGTEGERFGGGLKHAGCDYLAGSSPRDVELYETAARIRSQLNEEAK